MCVCVCVCANINLLHYTNVIMIYYVRLSSYIHVSYCMPVCIYADVISVYMCAVVYVCICIY